MPINFHFNFTNTKPLLSAPWGSTLTISDVLSGILQIQPFNFLNCPLGIMAIFLNRILGEISTRSSLFKFDKVFGTNEILKLFVNYLHGYTFLL